MTSKFFLLGLCCFLFLTSAAGCGKPELDLVEYHNTNIQRLHTAYSIYWMANGYRGPKDEQQLKDFLTTHEGAKLRLKRIGVSQDQVPDIFVSDRDDQPFKVRYGVNGPGDRPVIFEAEGIEGKRFVAYDVPVELERSEYEKCWAGKANVATEMGDPNDG